MNENLSRVGFVLFAMFMFAFWYAPAVSTCVVTGTWLDVDLNCQKAADFQKTYNAIGMSAIKSIQVYYDDSQSFRRRANAERDRKNMIDNLNALYDVKKETTP